MRVPGRRKPAPAAAQALTASAQVVTGKQLRAIIGQWSWQKAAYEFYDSCAELHFAINYIAQAASRAKLFVGVPDLDGASEPTPIDDDPQAQSLLDELGDDFTAHAELIRRMCIHLLVAGESFLIGMDDPAEGRKWVAASNDELQTAGDSVWLKTGPQARVVLPDEATQIIRVYYQNPRFSWEPESNVKALLADLARLQGLSSHILACTDSRLAGAGVLFVGESVSPPAGSPGDEVLHEDPFIDGLINSMIVPIEDRNSASAVVPYVVRVPDESLDKIKHVTFFTPFDEQVPTLIEITLKKIAIGLNMPAEILLGMGDVNHWGQWALQEDVVKTTIAPLLSVLCQAFTCKYLRPAYTLLPTTSGPCTSVIWFDTTELTSKPNKADEAMALYKEGLVGGATVRRENGFSDADVPTDNERLMTLLWTLAENPTSAPLVLPLLAPQLPPLTPPAPPALPVPEPRAPAAEDDSTGDGEAPDTGDKSIPDAPDRSSPPAANGRAKALPAGRGA